MPGWDRYPGGDAMELYEKRERFSHDLRNVAGLQQSLGIQALILKTGGELNGGQFL